MGLTRRQAEEMYNSDIWHDWSDLEIVKFQLFEDRLCVKWDRFQAAIESILGRPVFTHEFAGEDGAQRLRDEYLTLRQPPTMQDIVAMIPEEKLIALNMGSDKDAAESGDVADRLLGFLDDDTETGDDESAVLKAAHALGFTDDDAQVLECVECEERYMVSPSQQAWCPNCNSVRYKVVSTDAPAPDTDIEVNND